MTHTKDEALRLADALEQATYLLSVERDNTAAELRRLHGENERLKAVQPAPCTWTQSPDPHMPDTFNATCGVVWTFTDGGPAENDVRFCPGCGNKVVEGQP
jgi:hypothetical protein